MDIESHESAMLLKESSPRKRQGLALKLAVVLCGLGLLVNLIAPMGTLERALGSSSNFKDEKVTAAAALDRWPIRRDCRRLLRSGRADLQRELPGPRRRVARLRDVTHGSRAAGF